MSSYVKESRDIVVGLCQRVKAKILSVEILNFHLLQIVKSFTIGHKVSLDYTSVTAR